MELILAEKPSAARNFAKALGGKTGNYAGTEYKITNLRGHVMGLLPPDKQVPTEKVEFYKSWDLENLPWNLNDFAWKKGILSGCKDIISGLKDEYELIKGHVRDFPEYVGQTQIPIKPGFKAIFDSDSSSTEKSEGEEAENACEFGKVASPYVHEGANKRPQKPTMKWLTKKLEKYNVGTGATRTSTLAEITANEERALMKENKGALTMTKCGEVSYALLANCQIASPEVTEKLFESMNEVGRFSRKPSDVINTVTDMVVHDMKAMQDNIGALDGMKLGDGNAIVIGKCPKCGKDLYATKNQFRCAGVHFKKTGEKDGKAVFAQDGTCDFSIYRFVGPKDKPKKLTDKNGREIAEKGKTSLIKGIKKKSRDGTYDAYLTLNRETWSLDMKFPEFKGKKHKG